ncbi:sensor histidine kinase [Winogradskyella sp.]|jgi:sensor histidine kinase YesM|uniref:sensor histidine kinase n=1 Tax=Winogradskyella sp. TaxID=1883156 RepID=UPI0025D1E8D8|nr:sensor histidine kinase [Winogradskyella sp.]MCT4630489.1 sensor histidine kinase [Winogradskyella sp.]
MQDYLSKIIDYIQERRWLGHLLFWVILLLTQSLGVESLYDEQDIFIHKALMLPIKMLAAYTLIYFQVPVFLYKKRYVAFLVSFIVSSYVFTVLARITVVHGVEELIRPRPFAQESILEIATDIKALYARYYLGTYFPAIIMYILKLIKEKFYESRAIEQLEKQKVSSELNFFKAQIHPHFLFNTLNNLYVLTLQKSDKASDTVLKLSEILDYMLYQCNDNLVYVEKEMQLIENYINLEQLRYGDRLSLSFTHHIDNPNSKIAPLILISLVENAFKHGASGAIQNPIIDIDLKVEEGQMKFRIFNTKARFEQKDHTNYKEGIGLHNTKSQLQLLYPNTHVIEINDASESFEVKLNVDLNS